MHGVSGFSRRHHYINSIFLFNLTRPAGRKPAARQPKLSERGTASPSRGIAIGHAIAHPASLALGEPKESGTGEAKRQMADPLSNRRIPARPCRGVRATALELYSVLRVTLRLASVGLRLYNHILLYRVSRVSAVSRSRRCVRGSWCLVGVRSWGCYGSREWRLAWLSAASRTAVTCCCSLR